MPTTLSRREMIKATGAALVAGSISLPAQARPAAAVSPRQRALRIAHLTDIHVQPERRANDGMIACLHHAQNQADKPELILTGGDSVMDSFESIDARVKLQWDLWRSVLKNECSLPVKSCIGNHDVWGWNKKKSLATGAEPNFGKHRAIEMLNLSERYYSFTQSGWHFIVLDSTQSDGASGYIAYLDEEQFDWLQRDLAGTAPETPVLIMSHIPILTVTSLVWAKEERGEFCVDTSLMHRDALRLKTLFAQHPNVKLCLSGHIHLIDRVDYNGVTYLCNGAVSGNWWKGRHKDCDEGYALIDLYNDGTFEHQYVRYGWQAQA